MKIKYNGAIKASSDGNEDIVMYWDGQKVYEGPVDSDMTREIAWFLDDPEKLQEIVDYCNSFGDPVIEDTSDLMDVAATFVEMVGYELREAKSIDDDVYVSDEAGHFEIFEKSKEVEGACSSKKSVRVSQTVRAASSNDYIYVIMNNGDPIAKGTYDAMTKKSLTYNYPVTIKKFPKAKLNSLMKMAKEARRPDPLKFAVNRFINDYPDEYRAINSSCGRKPVQTAAVMAGPGAGYTIKWNLESINNINSFNVTNVSEPNEYGLITVEADCDVDVTVEIVEAYSYYYGIDRPINDVAAKMTKVSFEIDPDQWPELGSFYDAGVDFAAEFLNNEIYDTISNGEVMYGGGWSHSTWDGTLTDYEHDGLIEIKVTDEETIEYVDDAVSGELEGAYDDIEESKRINAVKSNKTAIKCTGDEYKVSQLRMMLNDIDYDNNPNWSHAILKSGSSKGINLDAGAINLLIDYYTNVYEPVEESKRINSSCGRKSIKSSDDGWTTDELVDKMNNNYRKHKRNKQQKDAEKFNAFNKKYAKHGIELKPTDDSNYGAYQIINKGTPMDRLDDFHDMERYADSLIETEEYVNSSRNRFNPSAKTPIKSSDFEFVFDENEEDEYDENDLSGYYSYDSLTPEQQDYAVAHWSDFSRCANTIYDWFNEDIMDFYHEDKQRIAEEFNENYGFDIKTDELYWGSSSQGPYPEWDNEKVFGKVWLANAGNLSDVDVSFGGSLTVDVWADYYVGEGDNEHIEYGIGIDELTTYGADEEAVKVISNLADGAQKFIDEIWNSIKETCRAYPDEEWVKGIFEANPSAFTFVVDENGDIEDIT